MSTYELVKFADAEELARSVAIRWLKEIEAFKGSPTPYTVALSGGRIARRLFSVVAELAGASGGLLDIVQFFWGDERCVPPADPESNFGLARGCLFEPLGVPESHLHRIRGEAPPELAAAEAAAELRRLAPRVRNGQPILDLVFLGLGEEGHVASLFPGESQEALDSHATFRAVVASKPPPRRITLGYPAIAAARQVWVLASGPGKENALRESLAPNGRTPLARVLESRNHTLVFTDLPV